MPGPRLAVRAVILIENRLLMVNAWPDGQSDLWCLPGGGVDRGTALPVNLAREVHEETGLTIAVGDPCLVNEFHDPAGDFHQVEIAFRCTVVAGRLSETWTDPEGIVTTRRTFDRDALRTIRFKPSSLPDIAWGHGLVYDPLEPILR